MSKSFDGEAALFQFTPEEYSTRRPRGIVELQSIYLKYRRTENDPADLRDELNSDLSEIDSYLESLNRTAIRFKRELEALSQDLISRRRQKIYKDTDLIRSLGLPLTPAIADMSRGGQVHPPDSAAERAHSSADPVVTKAIPGRDWDVFISHATEDKQYAEPLATALSAAGIRVWFDKTVLEWGDELRDKIDRGLSNCRFGIVIFSKSFLRKKKWTEYELNALFAREQRGEKLILPIWHGITREDLLEYSPAFADRMAKMSENDSHSEIVVSLLRMLGRT